MAKMNFESLSMLMTLFVLQNKDKKICEILDTDYDCTFGELILKEYKFIGEGFDLTFNERAVLRYINYEASTSVIIWHKSNANGKVIKIQDIIKHVNFEDKI